MYRRLKSIFLQKIQIFEAKFLKKLFKVVQRTFAKFCECSNFAIFNNYVLQKVKASTSLSSVVDAEKCCKMRIWLRNSVLIQPRTSLEKCEGAPGELGARVLPRDAMAEQQSAPSPALKSQHR